jgi:uncharacterized coiled-coil protein SlyX
MGETSNEEEIFVESSTANSPAVFEMLKKTLSQRNKRVFDLEEKIKKQSNHITTLSREVSDLKTNIGVYEEGLQRVIGENEVSLSD